MAGRVTLPHSADRDELCALAIERRRKHERAARTYWLDMIGKHGDGSEEARVARELYVACATSLAVAELARGDTKILVVA